MSSVSTFVRFKNRDLIVVTVTSYFEGRFFLESVSFIFWTYIVAVCITVSVRKHLSVDSKCVGSVRELLEDKVLVGLEFWLYSDDVAVVTA